MTELGIKCLSSGVGDLPCFATFISMIEHKIPRFSLYLFVYFFFCNIIVTGEPVHIALECIRRKNGTRLLLFSSERMPQLSVTEIAKWPLHFVFSYVQPVTHCYK